MMLEYIKLHPFAGIAIVLLVILTVFMWYKAITSGKKRSEEREKIIARLEKEKALRKEFKNLTEELFFADYDDFRLITGLCANVQMSIEKEDDMNAAFNELHPVKKYAYALGYVFSDGEEKMSGFFRETGEPLLSAALESVKSVIGGEFSGLFESEYAMFDEGNEDVSLDEKLIEEADGKIGEYYAAEKTAVLKKAADFFRENKNIFLNGNAE